MKEDFSIETFWAESKFTPNESQRKAILHIEGPLYLLYPLSGKHYAEALQSLKEMNLIGT